MRSVVVFLIAGILLAAWMIARVSTSLESGTESTHPDLSFSAIQAESAVRSQESRRYAQHESAVPTDSRYETSTQKGSNVEKRESTKGRLAALEREIEKLPRTESRRRVLEELLQTSKAAIDDLMDAGLALDDAERVVLTGNDNYFSCIREARAALAPNLVDQEYYKNCALIMLQETGLTEFPTTSD